MDALYAQLAEAIEKWATYFSISQKIRIEDVYLEQDHKDGKPLWNVDRLFGEIVAGMRKCKELVEA